MPPSATEAAAPLLRLAVPNELAALEAARLQVLASIDELGLPPRLVYQLELVLEETLMNRLWHAFPAGGRHCTDVELRLTPDALVLQFEDDGIAFDPLQHPPRKALTALDEAEPGGFGLLLTRKAARACRYDRIGNRNHFTVDLARA